MENNTFNYNYSAAQNKEVEAIRKKYLDRGEDKMDRLRRLDGKVQGAGMIEGLCVGIVGALIFGVAMCFGLGVFNTAWWPAVPIGILGVGVMLPAYPLYCRLHQKKKDELAPEILQLSEELMGSSSKGQ